MKKLISITLSLVMLISCLSAFPVSAETLAVDENGVLTVYFQPNGGDDTHSGTESSPVAKFSKAMELVRSHDSDVNLKEAKIVLVGGGWMNNSSANSNYTESSERSYPVTITSMNGTEILNLAGGRMKLRGDVVFDNITLYNGYASGKRTDIYAYGHSLTVTDTVKVNTGTHGLGLILGTDGGSDTTNSNKENEAAVLKVFGGKWDRVSAGGNEYGTPKLNDIKCEIGGNANIENFYIGTAPSANAHEILGTTNVTISGGTIGNVVIGGAQSGQTVTFKKAVNVKLTGGTITGNIGKADGATTVFTGGCTLDFSGYDNYDAVKEKIKNDNYNIRHTSILGYQKSTTDPSVIRIVVGVRSLDSEIVLKLKADGKDTLSKTMTTAYTGITQTFIKDGETTTLSMTAEELGANYLVVLTIKGVPSTANFTIEAVVDNESDSTQSFSI